MKISKKRTQNRIGSHYEYWFIHRQILGTIPRLRQKCDLSKPKIYDA